MNTFIDELDEIPPPPQDGDVDEEVPPPRDDRDALRAASRDGRDGREGSRAPRQVRKEAKTPDVPQVQVIRRSRTIHFLELALQRAERCSRAPQTLPSETKDLLYLTRSFLGAAGCARSEARLQQTVPPALMPPAPDASFSKDAMLLLSIHIHQQGAPADMESQWPVEALMQKTQKWSVVNENTKSEGATVDGLIERLVAVDADTPHLTGKPRIHFTSIFLYVYHYFTTADYLVSCMLRMLVTAAGASGQTMPEARATHIERRVIGLLTWLAVHRREDFSDDLASRVDVFAATIALRFPISAEMARALVTLRTAVQSRPLPGPYARRLAVAVTGPPPRPKMSVDVRVGSFLDIEDVELARQMCLLSFSMFERVRLREFDHAGWVHPQLRLASRNLTAFVDFLERSSRWMAWAIVGSPDADVRLLLYRKLVRCARHLYDLQNYAMLGAVFRAIDHHAVTRMSAAQTPLREDEAESIEAVRAAMNPFTSTLKEIPHTIESPAIPLLAPILGVLCRLEEVYPTFVSKGSAQMVNWSKMLEVGAPLIRLAAFQSTRYPFEPIPSIQQFLWGMAGVTSEDTIHALSTHHEP